MIHALQWESNGIQSIWKKNISRKFSQLFLRRAENNLTGEVIVYGIGFIENIMEYKSVNIITK